MDTFAFAIGWINCNDLDRSSLGLFFVVFSFPFAYCDRQINVIHFAQEGVSSRDQRSEQHVFERRYATAFHFVFSGSGALYSAHSPVIKRDWALRLSFSCTTGRLNRTSNLYLANLCHMFLREGSCKSRASCLEVNNNPSASSMLSIIKNAIVFYQQDSVEIYRLQ